MYRTPEVVWCKKVSNTELEKFQKRIERKYNNKFDTYSELHKWSVENYLNFWKEVWHYFGIINSVSYHKILLKTGTRFLDNEWFCGAKINLAENILKFRDNRIALICEDELGKRKTFTFAEVFDQVKLYAAAFRKLGLSVGDRVSYYMSNRQEAIFAMLATLSIGAIWSGSEVYFGAKAATRILKLLEPKFVVAVDSFQYEGEEYCLLENLKIIEKNLPKVEKIIVVNTKRKTLNEIDEIPKSIVLEDFLQLGRGPDGSVPDIQFEQLSANHPTNVNFTSGTTGTPKGVVHSAVAILAQLRDFSLHLNLKSGDVIYLFCPVGWAVWDYHIPILSLGATLLLFNGSPYSDNNKKTSVWETFDRNKVNYAYFASASIDSFDRKNIVPNTGTTLESLRVICLGASPVRSRHYEFLRTKVKKDLVVCSWYGSSEVFGSFSGLDVNSPMYACEIQGPSLGVDFHCYDETGNSVVGQRGNVVIATPNPAFPVSLWRDENNQMMDELYLKKFKIDAIEELEDFICVGQRKSSGESRAILFVQMAKNFSLTSSIRKKIEDSIEEELSDDCIPQVIVEVPGIPYNVNNKRMESVVRKIVETNVIPEVSNIRNPGCLQHFCNIPEVLNFHGNS